MNLQHNIVKKRAPGLLKNSAWGMGANMVQILLVSLFFAIIARKYNVAEFAQFLVSTTIYQLVAAFSTMGLSQWFIRTYFNEPDKTSFTSKFLKMQIGLGVAFYLFNAFLGFIIYPEGEVRWLGLILGTHIVIDNFMAALRSLNIAEGRQDKTARVIIIDGLMRLTVGCLLFVTPFSILMMATLTVVVRLLTISLFLKIGAAASITLRRIALAELSFQDLKLLIRSNWRFVVIGSVSIIYWRVGNLIISKLLTLADVADYELSFRIFSIFQLLPVVASATIYPQFIKLAAQEKWNEMKQLYGLLFFVYTLTAVLAYSFIFSFSGFIIPFAFGANYPNAVPCLQQMFLSFLIMPTVLLQANLIVSLGLERRDLHFNLISLAINISACLVGLYFFKSLAVINYAILLSLVSFHLLQDFLLVKRRFVTITQCMLFYVIVSCTAFSFYLMPNIIGLYRFYGLFMVICVGILCWAGFYQKQLLKSMFNWQSVERGQSC